MPLKALHAALDRSPFAPFVIVTSTGKRVDITSPRQVSVSPDGELIVVARGAAAGIEVISRHEFASVEPAGERLAAQAPTPPMSAVIATSGGAALIGTRIGQVVKTAPCGQVVLFPHRVQGVPVVTAIVQSEAGEPILDLSGTQFDAHGVDAGDNYFTIHLTHPGQPGKLVRLLIWPPDSGTLDTFSESMPLPALRKVLQASDEQLRRRPQDPKPSREYLAGLQPTSRADRRHMRDDDPRRTDPERFAIRREEWEVRPGKSVPVTSLIDQILSEPTFSLSGAGIEADIAPGDSPTVFRLMVKPWPGMSQPLVITLDADARLAVIPGSKRAVPLEFVERVLRAALCFDRPESLQMTLSAGPREWNQPVFALTRGDDVIVELWPGWERDGMSVLAPRVLGPSDRVVLDLRGTDWGARVTADDPHVHAGERAIPDGDTVTLHLVTQSGVRHERVLDRPIALNARTRRVTMPGVRGWTTAGVLQHLANEFGAPSVLLDNLMEALANGEGLPLIP